MSGDNARLRCVAVLEDTMTQRRLQAALWGLVLAASTGLAIIRYRAAVSGGIAGDLGTYFVPAARQLAQGASPYDVFGYVYSPLTALSILSILNSHHLVEYWTAASLMAAVLSVAFVTASERAELTWWQRPVLFGFAALRCSTTG